MDYHDGGRVHVGDRIKLWANCYGTVVLSIEDNAAVEGYNIDEWKYIGEGIMIKIDDGRLVHYNQSDQDLERA